MTENRKHATSRPDPQEIRGFRHYPGWLDLDEQKALIETLRGVVAQAPLFSPMTPYGKPMSVRMTSAGRLGWVIARAWKRPCDWRRTGVIVWASTLVGGMALRAVYGQGVQVSFVIVAGTVLAAFLVGWRGVSGAIAKRRGLKG